jgi:glycosyltransferase involved in cell wall biosynthesis
MGAYNVETHIAGTVESVLAQTEANFELVVIDDGSSDGTGAILDRYAERDERVRVVHHENRGLTRALIEGCALARAPLIARHDAGDLSEPDRLERQAALFDASPQLSFASCWTEFVGPELEHLYWMRGSGVADQPAYVLDPAAENPMLDGPSHHGSTMFRTSLYHQVGGYRAAFRYGQDWDLWYRLAAVGRFQMLAAPGYRARILPHSISVRARATQFRLARLSLEAMHARVRGESDEGLLLEATALSTGSSQPIGEAAGYYFIGETLRRRGHPHAAGYLLRAIRERPLYPQAWLRLLQAWVKSKR